MGIPSTTNVPGENRLLARLPRADRERLWPRLEAVSPEMRTVVYEAGAPITHVYFPLRGVYSLLIHMADGRGVEVGTVGNEGMLGTPVFLGTDKSPMRTICQVPPADALRMRAADFRVAIGGGGALQEMVRKYTQAMMNQIAQSVACNHLHSVEERCARWLLMTHDRVGQDQFALTQEFLAQMVGVRRPSVTVVAGVLQKAGLIAYTRGRVRVLDRAGLERAACECYAVVKAEFDRLLG